MALLAALFLVVAALYASVGFGGGSTYTALLILNAIDYRAVPMISLVCNIIVVAGGVLAFARAGCIDWRRIAPWIAASAPAAWIGGRLPLREDAFIAILGLALLIAGLLLISGAGARSDKPHRPVALPIALAGGGALGLLSGVTGIGGGILLAPLLHGLGWDTPRRIAGACCLFILINSVAGLAGQAAKLIEINAFTLATGYWPLAAAVFAGGQIGSRMGARVIPENLLRRLTGALIVYVAARLLAQWLHLASE